MSNNLTFLTFITVNVSSYLKLFKTRWITVEVDVEEKGLAPKYIRATFRLSKKVEPCEQIFYKAAFIWLKMPHIQ